MDILTYALCKKYVAKTADSLGAVKGAACRVDSIKPVTDPDGRTGYTTTLSWTGASGAKETNSFTLYDAQITPEEIAAAVDDYMKAHSIKVTVDSTLTKAGQAADAKAVGDALKKSAQVQPITKEEYDALSVEEQNNGTIYFIKDADDTTGSFKISKEINSESTFEEIASAKATFDLFKDLTGGSATLTEDVKVAGISVGNLSDGTVLKKGMDLTDVLKQMLQKVIHPTYARPSLVLSSTQNKIFEKGISYAITITPIFKQNDGGAFGELTWNDGTKVSTLSAKSYTITDTTIISASATYEQGPIKKDNFGTDDETGRIAAGTATGTIKFTAVSPFYYGTGTFNAATANKELTEKENKEYKYTTVNEVYYIAYPKSYGVLKNIKDQNNFDVLDTFVRTEENVAGTSYYVYTAASAATITNFAFTFKF